MVFTLIYGLYSGQLTPDSEIRNKNKIQSILKFSTKTAYFYSRPYTDLNVYMSINFIKKNRDLI